MTWENSAGISAIGTNSAADTAQPTSAEAPSSGADSVPGSRERMSMSAPVTAGEGKQVSEMDGHGALKALLDRTPAPVARQETGPAPSLVAIFGAPADPRETTQEADPAIPAGLEAIPAGVSLVSLAAQAAISETET